MMNTRNLLFILGIGILILTQSCKSSKASLASNNDNIKSLYFHQNEKEKVIDSEAITIAREKFAIRFFNKKYNAENKEYYAARIVALLKTSELDVIKTGMRLANMPRFSEGTAMAGKIGGYENLIFSNDGHHYLYYENAINRRLNLVKEGDLYQKLGFEIRGFLFYENGTKIPISESKLNEFYLAILIDRNLNGIIDDGELRKVTVILK